MSLLEWVRVAEDAREQQDDERVATGLESLRMAVGELVPLDRVALIAVDSPERARNEIRAACRRLSTRDPWKALAPAVFRDLVEGLISTVFGLGPLENLIADETVTEIMVNGTDSVYIERDGRLSRASVSFESDEQVRALIDRILGPLGRRVDESSPMASARLPQGPSRQRGAAAALPQWAAAHHSRLHAARYDAGRAESERFVRRDGRAVSHLGCGVAPFHCGFRWHGQRQDDAFERPFLPYLPRGARHHHRGCRRIEVRRASPRGALGSSGAQRRGRRRGDHTGVGG